MGEFGDFASFSFQASKHLTCGEGGMLITNNEELADKARRLNCLGYAGVSGKQGKITRNDIQDPNYSRHVSFGYNYRMSELQAACALGQLERAKDLTEQRIRVAEIFDKAVEGQTLLKKQAAAEGYKNSYWTYCLVLDTEDPDRDWYRFRDIEDMCRLCTVSRSPDYEYDTLVDYGVRLFGSTGKLDIIDIEPYEISSTGIRDLIREGGDASEYLEPAVCAYIEENGLYG